MSTPNEAPGWGGWSVNTILVLAAVGVVLLPMSILGVGSLWRMRDLVSAQALATNQVTARNLASDYEQFLGLHLQALVAAADQAAGAAPLTREALMPILLRSRAAFPALTPCFALDPAGKSVAFTAADGSRRVGVDYADRQDFQEVVRTRAPYIDRGVNLGKVTGLLTVGLATPILGADGRLKGVLAAGLDLSKIQAAGQIRLGRTGFAVVTTADGTPVVHPRADLIGRHGFFQTLPVWESLAGKSEGPLVGYVGAGGQGRFGAFATVPGVAWKVWVSQERSEIADEVRAAYAAVLPWVLLALGGGLVIMGALAAAIVRPLRGLSQAVTQMGATHTAGPAPEVGPKEVRTLARNFNQMAAHLSQHIQEQEQAEAALQRSHAELEQRVTDRTAELAATVALLQREVAERFAAEQATQAERQRLYEVLETLPVYVVLMTADYHVPFANRFFRERFGESHGRRCFEYLFGRAEPCENCESFTVLKTGAAHHWEWTGPDGRNYDIYDFPFADTDGSPFILEMGIDVTAQKQAATALQAAHAELADRADRLRTLTTELTLAEQRERRRLADVLHDELQQLLVATRLRAHMLGRTADPTVQQGAQEIAALIEKALGQTRSLTGELSPPALQSGSLLPALEWLIRWVGEKHHLTVQFTPPPAPLPRVPEDTAVLLYQGVRELLLNTVKYAQVDTATVTVTQDAAGLTLTVADAGVGFDPTRLRVAGGTEGGVGLLGIRERLEAVGGRLAITSAPAEGSRLTLTLPLPGVREERVAPEPPAAPGGEVEQGVPAAGRRLRVLVVDDQALVRRGFATLLAEAPDLEVVGEAENGQRAIELTRQLAPDVILMDISMPVLDGIAATRVIHAEFPVLRVIGLSMAEDPAPAEAMRQAGAVGYLSKNTAADALLAAVRGGPPPA